ncbi:MAG: hypothetical protein AVDCRST_MAG69-295, partial [uncultured Solirubrobacteraceae bacterium]
DEQGAGRGRKRSFVLRERTIMFAGTERRCSVQPNNNPL